MYKIVYCFSTVTNLTFTEYGFSNYILKRYITLSEEEHIEKIDIFPLCKTWDLFKKCVTKTSKIS